MHLLLLVLYLAMDFKQWRVAEITRWDAYWPKFFVKHPQNKQPVCFKVAMFGLK